MKSLVEIERAIARLPKKSRLQLVRDIPALCANVFPADGWGAILTDRVPRTGLTAFLDQLDAEYNSHPEEFLILSC